jgi:hypothetical protein
VAPCLLLGTARSGKAADAGPFSIWTAGKPCGLFEEGAVPHFYFHLINDVDAPDEEGVELPDLAAARQCAERSLRFTTGESLKESGRLILCHLIQIEDAEGNVLDTVHVRDVVKVET